MYDVENSINVPSTCITTWSSASFNIGNFVTTSRKYLCQLKTIVHERLHMPLFWLIKFIVSVGVIQTFTHCSLLRTFPWRHLFLVRYFVVFFIDCALNAHFYSDGNDILVQKRSNINMRSYHLLWYFGAILQSCYFVNSYKTSHPSTNIEMLRTWLITWIMIVCRPYFSFKDFKSL